MNKTYNGGYVMLDLADKKLYERAKAAIGSGKPVMLYDNDAVYYIDTISLDDTNVVITKGGKTITIAADGTITESGEIQPSGSGGNAPLIVTLSCATNPDDNESTLLNQDKSDLEIYTAFKEGRLVLCKFYYSDEDLTFDLNSIIVSASFDEDRYYFGIVRDNSGRSLYITYTSTIGFEITHD